MPFGSLPAPAIDIQPMTPFYDRSGARLEAMASASIRLASLPPPLVLVVEDDFVFAEDVSEAMLERGMCPIGPAGSVGEALDLLAAHPRTDAAVLDINLRGSRSFEVAHALVHAMVPFLFVTGLSSLIIPAELRMTPTYRKPIAADALVEAVDRCMGARSVS